MMTERLYYTSAYIFSFDAVVTDITVHNGKKAIVLDRTAFFPEGGGQPGDEGSIGDAIIIDTQIDNGVIYHYFNGSPGLHKGSAVRCAVDRELRFSRMQAHTGEHIVSGIAHTMFGADNVGFHMDGTVMTVDFNKYLSKDELADVEKAANECVYKNVAVRAYFPDGEKLKEMIYRSKTEVTDETRIVEIEGYDLCACCAPHVSSTGEVGLIKILTSVKHRGGVRLTLICGRTAYEDYAVKHNNTLVISDLLCSKHNEADKAVIKLLEKEKELKYIAAQKTIALLDYIYDNTDYTEKSAVFRINGLTNDELKNAAVKLRGKSGGITAVISGDDCKGYYFAASSESVKIQNFTKTVTDALKGSGGGRYDVIQGKFNTAYSSIIEFFNGLQVDRNENEKKKTPR